jgi:L-ascorbate metabolism protein UlaG (beta-lactamase superfamily)
MLPSKHGKALFGKIPYPGEIDPELSIPMKANEYRHGMVFVPKLEMGGTVFIQVGSANYIDSALEGHHCDVLFMCVPGWKHNPGYTGALLEIINPKVIVPFHYDDFSTPLPPDMRARPLPFQDIPQFIQEVRENYPKAEIRKLSTYETAAF